MFFKTYVAMDITNSDVRVLAVRKNKIEKWDSVPIPEGAVKDGMIFEPQTVGVVIDNLFTSLKLKRDHVICSVTGLPFIYRVIGMPGDEQAVPNEAIERAARQEMSLNQEDMYLLWQATESKVDSNEKDYFVLGVPKTSLKPLIDTLVKAKIKPYALDVKPLALARVASLKEALIVSLERSYYDVVIVSEGLVRVMHSVNPSAKNAEPISVVNELVDGMNKAIKSFNRDFPQNTLQPDTPVLLTGELSSNEDIIKVMHEATGHPVNILTAPVETPQEMSLALYAAALGLVSRKINHFADGSSYHDIDINLLSKIKQGGQLRHQLAYGGAILAVLLLCALVYEANNLKSDATARTESLQKESTRVSQVLATTQKTLDQSQADKQTATANLQNVTDELTALTNEHEQIMGQQSDYAGRINLINTAFPDEADYNNLSMQPDAITLQGHVAETFDILVFTEALERSTTFSSARINSIAPVQDSEGATFNLTITSAK